MGEGEKHTSWASQAEVVTTGDSWEWREGRKGRLKRERERESERGRGKRRRGLRVRKKGMVYYQHWHSKHLRTLSNDAMSFKFLFASGTTCFNTKKFAYSDFEAVGIYGNRDD